LAEKGYLSLYDLAHFLVAANVSDVASMGAKPKGFLDVFRYPQGIDKSEQEAFFSGLADAVNHYSVELVGGDSGSYKEYVLAGTCFGFIEKEKALFRKNLQVGDLLCFSGSIGGCRAAQVHFLKNHPNKVINTELDEELINFWRKPAPPISIGPLLSDRGWSIAAQDTSDGLASTVYGMCRDSGVGAIIYEKKLPIAEAVKTVAKEADMNLIELALGTSPDFGLLFSIKSKDEEILDDDIFDNKATVIGKVTNETEVLLETETHKLIPLPYDGWSQGTFKV
jgi:thiamine-monophosphate kinase